MLAVQADRIDLLEVWTQDDPTRGIRFGLAVSTLNGAANSAVAYIEVDVGNTRECTITVQKRPTS